MSPMLGRYFDRLALDQPWRWSGRVIQSLGNTIDSAGPLISIGECCEIEDSLGMTHAAEVIGFC